MHNVIKYEKMLETYNIDKSLAKYYYDYLIKNNSYNKKKFNDGINKLIDGLPIQYIIGNVNFYGNIIKVNNNVLIPRFETEQLLEKTINLIKDNFNINSSVLDIGTGSGCIAISLKKERPNLNVDACDISETALKIAKENAILNNVNINFITSDIFTNINKKYDIIISNPPYIKEDEQIMDIVKNNEPHIALYAKENGLEFYQKIISEAKKVLNEKFIIALEIGETEGNDIIKIASNNYPNAIIKLEKDNYNRDRFIFIINI